MTWTGGVFNLLAQAGYLTVVERRGTMCSHAVPNLEVIQVFKRWMRRWLNDGERTTNSIVDALVNGRSEEAADEFHMNVSVSLNPRSGGLESSY